MMDIDSILSEWARWSKRRNWASSNCLSAERFYRPELGEVWDDEPKSIPIDLSQAWSVECAWRLVPFKERMIVKANYITSPTVRGSTYSWEGHKRKVCRSLSIQRRDFDLYLVRGSAMIHNLLRFSHKKPTIRADFPPLGQKRVQDRQIAGFGVS
jgi:hypothetical protein